MKATLPNYWAAASLLFIASGLLPGCGSGETTTSTTPEPTAVSDPTVSQDNSAKTSSTDSEQPRRQNERWTDANGVEYLGNVPLDVFYDQPYTVASNQTPLGGIAANSSQSEPAGGAMSGGAMSGGAMSSSGVMSGGTTPAFEPDTTDTASVTGSDKSAGWAEIMPMETLTTEVNSLRNFLNNSLQSVGSYNRSMLMVAPKAASLAVLSGIAMEHPEALNWKEDAIYVRDLAKQMNAESLQPGKKDQDRLLRLFEKIANILDRSKPADLEEPEASDSFPDVAEMRLIMMRMEAAEKKLKTEAGSESAFSSQKEMIQHEAAILGAMTHVVTLPGYGYEDDPEFVGFAKRIVDAAKEIRNATEVSDFSSYELALTKVSTACQECHSQFKNN